jgi:transcriptional regulator with XRE-family HTH domain
MQEHYGIVIRDERMRKGLSQNKLASLAGISRRHLASIEQGANVSVDVLRGVTRVLGISHLDLGDGLTAEFHPHGLAVGDVLPLADAIEAGAASIGRFAKNLRAKAQEGDGKSIRNDTPSGEVSEPSAHLVELALKFAKNAGTLTDRAKIDQLERDVSELLDRSNTA